MNEQDLVKEYEGEENMRAKIMLTSIAILFLAIVFTTIGLLLGAHIRLTEEIKKTKGYTKIRYGVGINCGCDTIRYKEFGEIYREYLLQQRDSNRTDTDTN